MSTPKWISPVVSIGNLIQIALIVSSIIWFAAGQDKTNAIQDTKIQVNYNRIEQGLQNERLLTREAIADLRQQAAQDRAEMKRQFDKLNDKLDKLIEGKPH